MRDTHAGCARAWLYLQNNACESQSHGANWDDLPSSIANGANHRGADQPAAAGAVTWPRGSCALIGRRNTASWVHLCSGSEWLTLSVQGHHSPGKGGKFDPLSHGSQSTGVVFSQLFAHRIFPLSGLVGCSFFFFFFFIFFRILSFLMQNVAARCLHLSRPSKLDFNFYFCFLPLS